MKRAEYFSQLHKELMEVVVSTRIGTALENDADALHNLSYDEKFRLLGYSEKVALMLNSGLVKENVVHYMFGYYAIKCYESEEFWDELDKESQYWDSFRRFAKRMKKKQDGVSTHNLKF